ncbi:MAG: DNA polymerase I [Candidatus Omnitrophica bacterium]|nr:DNA polymerase I [Candidatus Omnitrophota bacterium]
MATIPRIILIDTHALCYRAFYAVKDLRNSKGQPTNAVFGFVNILKKILSRYQPAYVAACFDVGRHTRRTEQFAEYKAQRAAMPEDLVSQIPLIQEVVRGFNIPIFAIAGQEADDIIAVLARRFRSGEREVIIVSDDKDLHQLLSDGVRIYNSRRDALLGPEDTRERFGVTPDQMVDYLSLAGDASDNIPGVDGIGEVTARKLITQYGSLDNVLAHTGELAGKLKDKMLAGKDSALLSRELATLAVDIDVVGELADIKWPGIDADRLKQLFAELEFRVQLDGLPRPGMVGASVVPSAAPVKMIKARLVVETFPFMASGDAAAVCKEALATGRLAFLLADNGEVAAAAGASFFQCHIGGLAGISAVLAAPEVLKVLYDAKSVRKSLAEAGVVIDGNIFDLLLAGYLINDGLSAYNIEALAWRHLELAIEADSGDYLARKAQALLGLYDPVMGTLKERGLLELYQDVEYSLSAVLFEMEKEGVGLDVGLLAELSQDSAARIAAMNIRLQALAGEDFNCNSPKQLGHILFDKLHLPVIKKTKTGPSTDEEVLTRLASQHELPALVLEYRQLSKLKSTYIDALPKMVSPLTGRIHCSFNQTGAETGRLSSSHPNLQNIPIRTAEGRMIRRAFIPSAGGRVLLSADYSQIELRVLAHLADEQNLKQAFNNGEDIHTYTAGLIFDVPPALVTTEMRYSAKRINFGIIYGMSAFGLAKDLGVSNKEAKGFIERYFLRYPGIQSFMEQEIEKARSLGYVETMFRRRRYLPDINSRNPMMRQFAERQAINTPVQGTAADIIKIAMVHMARAIKLGHGNGRMIITVHDELVFEVPGDEAATLGALVKETMEKAVQLSVPIGVTVKSGPNWADMKEL